MKAAFYTLGCKVNQYESEYMAELLKNAGFEIVSSNDEADYYIVNSCTVTATADQKTRQNVRKFKRKHPNSTVILTGCMPQAFPESAEQLDEADIVLSNKSNNDILTLINQYTATHNRIVDIKSMSATMHSQHARLTTLIKESEHLLKLRTVVTDFVHTALFRCRVAEFAQSHLMI